MSVFKIKSWSPSRIDTYDECPSKVKYKDLMKLCPVCFRGRISGGFDGKPVVCDSCTKDQPEREPLERGNMLDAALTKAVAKKEKIPKDYHFNLSEAEQPLAAATRHPKIEALVKKLQKLKGVFTQHRIAVDREWRKLHEDPAKGIFANAWGRLVLDVLILKPKEAEIIDWKSGNIDKKTHEIREKTSYAFSMRLYQIGTLATNPKLTKVSARMAFLDAPPKLEKPFKEVPLLTRAELPELQRRAEEKIEKMMNDTNLAPRPGFYCGWCDYSKRKGGPCPF